MNAAKFIEIIQRNPTNRQLLERLPYTGLNDVWLVSGCLFQTYWNSKTGRAPEYGIKDYDLFYFDGDDLSWDAEDDAIRRAMRVLRHIGGKVEIRNQARVHLWYEQKFGLSYEPLHKTTDGIDRFLASACMFGVTRSTDGNTKVYAPKGYDDLEQLVVRPNSLGKFDTKTFRKKARRWCEYWPELCLATTDP